MTQQPKSRPGVFSRLFGRGAAPRPEQPEETEAGEQEARTEADEARTGGLPPSEDAPAGASWEDRGSGDKPAALPDPGPPEATQADTAAAQPEAEAADSGAVPEPRAEPAPAPSAEAEAGVSTRRGWFWRLREGLQRSSNRLTTGIADVFTKRRLDSEMLDQLEDLLIQADLGVDAAMEIAEALRDDRFDKDITPEEVKAFLAGEIARRLEPVAVPLRIPETPRPFVVLVVGVNGSGKTTTIGKLAARFRQEGHSVVLAAGDTFRAAAIDQLKIWGERVGAPVVAREVGADAAGLAFDAYDRAAREGADVLMVDTAGRLQNKADLMAELEKVVRILRRKADGAPHAVLLVLDATVGQNAISQASIFRDVAGVTGLVMTKLDGTARGGILVALAEKFGLPVHAIGVGESVDDLQPFSAEEFARAIAGVEESA